AQAGEDRLLEGVGRERHPPRQPLVRGEADHDAVPGAGTPARPADVDATAARAGVPQQPREQGDVGPAPARLVPPPRGVAAAGQAQRLLGDGGEVTGDRVAVGRAVPAPAGLVLADRPAVAQYPADVSPHPLARLAERGVALLAQAAADERLPVA